MRILLDAFPLLAPLSGVGYYTLRLLRSLREEAPEDEHIYFYGRRFSRRILEAAPSFDAGLRTFLKSRLKKPYKLIQPIKETLFRLGAPLCKAQLYHETNYVPLPYSGPQVVTVFDMSLLRFPETHPADRVAYFSDYFLKRLPNADRIITISDFSKRELVQLCGVPEERVTTIHLGGLEVPRPSREEIGSYKKEKGLPEEYYLYTGNLEPRKNLLVLIEGYRQALDRDRELPPLLLAGNPSWLSEPIFQAIESHGLKDRVIPVGYVPARELPLLYAGALAFLFPSKYEGFGLPALEAMGLGVPVAAADASSLPEVCGQAALLLSPEDPAPWGEALLKFREPALRQSQGEAALARAAEFSWGRCARETRGVYARVLRERGVPLDF